MLRPAALFAIGSCLCAAACAAPSLEVQFDIPDAYAADVASVRLQVLEPPPSEPFGCDAVAFRSVSDDLLRLSTTLQVALDDRDAEQPLVGIRRVGPKLLFAEGLDARGELVVAACAQLDTIDEDVELTLLGEPAAVAALGSIAPPAGDSFPAPPSMLPVSASDVHGAPLSGAEVRWTVIGPAGESKHGNEHIDGAGHAELHPAPTALAGPALTEVSVRWSQRALPPLRFFQPPREQRSWELPMPIPQSGAPASLLHVGRFGPGGEMAFAVAVADPAGPISQAIGYPGGPTDPLLVPPPAEGFTPLVVVPATGRDRLVGRGEASWYELDLSQGGSWTARPAADTHAEAIRAVDAGACDGSSALVLVEFADGALRGYDPDQDFALVEGPFTADPALSRLIDSGCVAGTDGAAHRVVILAPSPCTGDCPEEHTLVADFDGRRTAVLDLGDGVPTYIAPATRDGPPLLLQTYLDLEGIWLGRFQLAPADADRLELQLVDRDATGLPVFALAGGDFDADGGLDLLAMLAVERAEDGDQSLLPFAAIATEHRGERIRVFGGMDEAPLPTLRARDFDGDGYDDVLLMTGTSIGVAFFGPTEAGP